jgi:hypothetical protein
MGMSEEAAAKSVAAEYNTKSEVVRQVAMIDKLIGEINGGLDDLTTTLGPVITEHDIHAQPPDSPEEAMQSAMGRELNSHVRRLSLVSRRIRELTGQLRV